MRTFDFSPLFRSSVGFDRLAQLMDSARDDAPTYPPYNIERTGEDQYRITMAVAGFAESDIEITAQENALTVVGKQPKDEAPKSLLYRGIAGRPFQRRFELAEYIRVSGASLENGLLHIELVREVPEAVKPRTIKIGGGSTPKAVEQKAA
ncbi:Hsp20 family protein [Dongia sp.]|uniref:Hsp20 family protein n=1 Tax=Dongia sp. TaxID=1977262 RepID=UPI003753B9CF